MGEIENGIIAVLGYWKIFDEKVNWKNFKKFHESESFWAVYVLPTTSEVRFDLGFQIYGTNCNR